MSTVVKYNTSNISKFLEDFDKYAIGMDDWFRRVSSIAPIQTNYPPYNTIKESETDYRLEVALAGFKKDEISVYTESGKLVIDGNKKETEQNEYVYQGLATRAFTREWTLPDDLEVKGVSFVDGLLTVRLTRIVPEHQKKKVWF